MLIESFIEIIGGELKNIPSINSFDNFVFESTKVKRGDIFITSKESDIDEALENGAYGIIFEDEVEIKDEEIAWIKVSSIDKALAKYLRYFLLEKGVIVCYFSENSYEILKSIAISSRILYLNGDIKKDFQNILTDKATFIISNSKEFLDTIYPLYKKIDTLADITLIRSSIFKTSFIYKDIYYKGIKIAQIHQKQLQKVLAFFEKYRVDFDMTKLGYITNFYPLFINDTLEEVDFGDSSKVLIFAKNSKYIDEDILYLKKNTKWAKSLIFVPSSFVINENVEIYSGYQDLITQLKKNFNFAIVYGDKNEFLDNLYQFLQKQNRPTLF